MARNYAALPHEYIEEFKELSYEEIGILLMALLQYSATGEEPELKGNERFLWRRVAAQENRFQDSYEEIVNVRREAGRKGADSRWSKNKEEYAVSDGKNGKAIPAIDKNGKAIPAIGKNDYTETDTDTDTKTNTKTNTNTKTLPSIEGEYCPRPTVEEVASYARGRNSSVDPERFVDYYASKGWKIGDTPMEDWEAAFRNWERSEQTRSASAPSPQKVVAPVDRWDCSTPYPTVENVRTLERLEMLRRQMNAQSEQQASEISATQERYG